jgi:hypothetical protein
MANEYKNSSIIKHSAAIHIQNNITLLQRKVWNVLLFNAYDDLPLQEIYNIPVKVLKSHLNYNSNDEEYLKQIVRALVNCSVEWNILDKDGKQEWGVAGLLAQVKIKEGMCSYAYAPEMRSRLHNPSMYARISLSLQNVFDGKYGQTLWELCVDYLGHEREYGETPFITIEQFHKLMGVENSQYVRQFKILNRDVLKPAVAEINKVSDLRVEVAQQRKGRKVVALKFKIRRVAMLPVTDAQQHSLFPDFEDMPEVVKLLREVGLSDNDAWEIWQKGFLFVQPSKRPVVDDNDSKTAFIQYVNEKIHLLKLRQESDRGVSNPSGFLVQAIRLNYGNPQFEKEQAARKRADKVRQLQKLTTKRDQIERERDDALSMLTNRIVQGEGQADEAIANLKTEGHPAFKLFYNSTIPALDNYHAHRGIAMGVSEWAERKFPVQFQKVRRKFEQPLAELDKQIIALQEIDGTSKR